MGNSPLSTILLIALMVVAFYFLLLRPQKKRQQAQQKTMNQIGPGTRVLLGSGIFGTVVSAGEKQAVLETSPGVHVTVLKQAIARIIQPGDEFSEPVEADEADEVTDLDATGTPEPTPKYNTPSTFERPSDYDPLAARDHPAAYDSAADPTFGNEPKNKD